MTARAAWKLLGLKPGDDAGAVRKAYADRLRAMDPDGDPAGFARLRAARDAALGDVRRQAASVPSETTPVPNVDLPDTAEPDTVESAVPWRHAAPHIDRAIPPGYVAATGDPGEQPQTATVSPASGPAETPLILRAKPYTTPVLAIAGRGDVVADRGRGAALQQLLTDAPPAEPFDDAGERRALDHLDALLRMASAATIEDSRKLEDWIADQLANAWPRSAPLLAPAATAFGWVNDLGTIGERPAIAFLNARLAGLRFVEAVEQPDHDLYKAWAELSKPGHKRSFGIKRVDVRDLLAGVRKHFPEIEQYLDPQRVAAWDKAPPRATLSFTGQRWRIGFRKGWYWFVLIAAGLRLLAGLMGNDDPGGYRSHPTPVANTWAKAEFDTMSRYWFGPNFDYAQLSAQEPLIAMTGMNALGRGDDLATIDLDFRDAVFKVLRAARGKADHAGLREVQTLRRDVMKSLPATNDAQACLNFDRNDHLPLYYVLDPDLLAQTKAVVRDTMRFRGMPDKGPGSGGAAQVPGSVMQNMMAREHLDRSALEQALLHKGPGIIQCRVHFDLIDFALGLPGMRGDAMLRVL